MLVRYSDFMSEFFKDYAPELTHSSWQDSPKDLEKKLKQYKFDVNCLLIIGHGRTFSISDTLCLIDTNVEMVNKMLKKIAKRNTRIELIERTRKTHVIPGLRTYYGSEAKKFQFTVEIHSTNLKTEYRTLLKICNGNLEQTINYIMKEIK